MHDNKSVTTCIKYGNIYSVWYAGKNNTIIRQDDFIVFIYYIICEFTPIKI